MLFPVGCTLFELWNDKLLTVTQTQGMVELDLVIFPLKHYRINLKMKYSKAIIHKTF